MYTIFIFHGNLFCNLINILNMFLQIILQLCFKGPNCYGLYYSGLHDYNIVYRA